MVLLQVRLLFQFFIFFFPNKKRLPLWQPLSLNGKWLSSTIAPDYRTTLLPELSPLIEINNNDYVNFRLHVFIHVKIQSTLHFFLKKDNREDKNYCSVSEHPPKMLKNFGIIIGENTLNQIYCMNKW